jgi:hypothetical protein
MSPDLVLFAVGGLLLVTGLLGGGFEMRELRVPEVGTIARVLATAAGCTCILLGLGLTTVAVPPDDDAEASGPVHFTVRDELVAPQISEQVTLILDGRRVGDLTVNEAYPTSELEVSVDEPGRHDYTLGVSTLELDESGAVVERDGSGQGTVMVEQGASYHVEYAEGGDGRDLTLVAD